MDLPTGAAVTDPTAELHRKLDLLTDQMQQLSQQTLLLAEQARRAERASQERAELMRDLTPIANDLFRLSVEQLEEVQEYVDLADLLRLAKRMLRNGHNIEKMLDQLESVMDLLQTAGPLSDEMFGKAVTLLQQAEQRGYFRLAQGGTRIVDNIVTSFTGDDIDRLGDNVVLMLNTVKDMTQPEILGFIRGLMAQAEVEVAKPVDTSLPALLGQMRDPDVRRGLTLTMRVLKLVGAQANQKP
ncbi:MAG: hypothetical protein BWY52_01876 [Chloroflexi bacterium ADurb.Bin325]|nr:MAG: hypothetical protein BWY52_01876 [Chloroflexi bacterium ADurb.Bin325]